MATTNDLINGLKASKEAIRQAIIAKGVDVPESTLLSGYAPLVEAISGGGGGFDYEGEMNKIVSTVESGYGDICVCMICSAYKNTNTFSVAKLSTTINRIEFSDGTVQTDVNYAMEHKLTSLLDADGFQYYWAKCYIDTFDDISMPSNMIAVAYKFLGSVPSLVVPDTSLKYFDIGGCSVSSMDTILTKNKDIEYVMNVTFTSYSLDCSKIKYVKKMSFVNLDKVTDNVSVENLCFLDQDVITGMINLLPEGGFLSRFSADYLTEEQKALLDAKSWSY